MSLFAEGDMRESRSKRPWEKRWDEEEKDWFENFGKMKIETQVIPRTKILSEFLKPEYKVLDIGCGAGRYFNSIVRRSMLIPVEDYTGIDGAEGMLAEARRLYPEGDFRKGDAFNLEFSDGSFDMCLLMDVIQHIPDYKPLIKEMHRVSNKYIVVVTWWTKGKELNTAKPPKIRN
jgi:ubiquinone/menaquinone biosynthesis C-methylase UbiE